MYEKQCEGNKEPLSGASCPLNSIDPVMTSLASSVPQLDHKQHVFMGKRIQTSSDLADFFFDLTNTHAVSSQQPLGREAPVHHRKHPPGTSTEAQSQKIFQKSTDDVFFQFYFSPPHPLTVKVVLPGSLMVQMWSRLCCNSPQECCTGAHTASSNTSSGHRCKDEEVAPPPTYPGRSGNVGGAG